MKETGRTGGDSPHEGKKQNKPERQGRKFLPELFLRRREGDDVLRAPLEKSPKKDKELSPREIAEESFEQATDLFFTMSKSGSKERVSDFPLRDLSEVSFVNRDAHGLRQLGQQWERFRKGQELGAVAAELYFNAALLGNTDASDDLQRLLKKERKEVSRTKTDLLPYSFSDLLSKVVSLCGKRGLPADSWISQYSVDQNQSAALKLAYYSDAKDVTGEAKNIGLSYRGEVTNQFLQGEGISDEVAWELSAKIYRAQDDPEKKRQIFARFQDLQRDVQIDEKSKGRFFEFIEWALKDRDVIEPNDTVWIEETAAHYFAEVEEEPIDLLRRQGQLQLSLMEYSGATANELVQGITNNTRDQLRELGEDDQDYLMELRDHDFGHYTGEYAAVGDFISANRFLSEIADDRKRSLHMKLCLDQAKTPDDLAKIKPDEFALSMDENLRKLFAAKEIILGEDNQAIGGLARSFANEIYPYNKSHSSDLLEECVQATYEKDPEAGTALSSEVLAILKKREPSSFAIRRLAEMQLANGDTAGMQLLYDQATQQTRPSEKLRALAHLALLSTKAVKKEKSGSEE